MSSSSGACTKDCTASACGGVSPKTTKPQGNIKGGQGSRRGSCLLKENDIGESSVM